jgi:hypothetical protein
MQAVGRNRSSIPSDLDSPLERLNESWDLLGGLSEKLVETFLALPLCLAAFASSMLVGSPATISATIPMP